MYCYTCDDSRIDPDLPRHLEHFGMSVVDMRKTDKSMTELVREAAFSFGIALYSRVVFSVANRTQPQVRLFDDGRRWQGT